MKSKKALIKTVKLPEGVSATYEQDKICVKGPKGEINRAIKSKSLIVTVSNENISVNSKIEKKKEKKQINTLVSHIKNMIKGVTDGFQYELSAVFKHFPLNLELKGNTLFVKNFLGEKHPRQCEIIEGVDLKLNGQEIVLTGINKELVGCMASKLEQLTRVTGFDRRIFQDGIFITKKDGKLV